jgi:hypothetical protein
MLAYYVDIHMHGNPCSNYFARYDMMQNLGILSFCGEKIVCNAGKNNFGSKQDIKVILSPIFSVRISGHVMAVWPIKC